MTPAEQERINAEIKRRVAEAPPLTAAQRDRLAALLRPVQRDPGRRDRRGEPAGPRGRMSETVAEGPDRVIPRCPRLNQDVAGTEVV
jgi:hypothetical protein